jgi:hypothetical protein
MRSWRRGIVMGWACGERRAEDTGCIRRRTEVAEARKERNGEESVSVQANGEERVGFSLPGRTADVDRLHVKRNR